MLSIKHYNFPRLLNKTSIENKMKTKKKGSSNQIKLNRRKITRTSNKLLSLTICRLLSGGNQIRFGRAKLLNARKTKRRCLSECRRRAMAKEDEREREGDGAWRGGAFSREVSREINSVRYRGERGRRAAAGKSRSYELQVYTYTSV